MVDLNIKLPDGFLDEEVRCGYTISKKMKEVWAVELDLLMEFDRVCKKYDIKYCADGGTLLGAVRHKGFIPWDDDIDIAMLRSEYEKLNEVASKEFKSPYFWQTEETDPGSARGHAQFRNSNTTGMLLSEYKGKRNNNFNQGIFIDIFPFDTIVEDDKKLIEQDKKRMELRFKYTNILDSVDQFYGKPWIDGSGKKHRNIRKFIRRIKYKMTGESYKKVYDQFIDEITKYNNFDDSEFVVNFCMPLPIKHSTRFREDFNELKMMDFEFLKLPVFKNYDRNLKFSYGNDYMTPIQASTEHGDLIVDTDKAYTWYLDKRK